jgi:acyl-CoA synthetase (AMP-forming)/AMP-acid ligase II
MAEATLMLTGPERQRAYDTVQLDADALAENRVAQPCSNRIVEVVSCGRARGNEEIFIVDPHTCMPVPDGRVGEIWATGPSIARGYWADPAASTAHFSARIPTCPEKRFLRTGDLGFLRDGELYVTGRLKSLLIINGRNYYPQDIESTVSSLHHAFRPQSAVFADDDLNPTQIVLVQEVYKHRVKRLDATDILTLIRRKVFTAHGINLDEIVLTTSRIPVTTSGKVRRNACREAWRSGLLALLEKQTAAHGGEGSDAFYGREEA